MRLYPPISSASVVGIGKFVVQIPSIDEILMRYWVEVQVGTMIISVIYKSKFSIHYMILRRFLMITCEMLFGDHLSNTRSIVLLVSGRGIVDVLGDAL